MGMAKQKTTREIKFNSYQTDVNLDAVYSYTPSDKTKNIQNIKLIGVEEGIRVNGSLIKDHAAANTTAIDMGYKVSVDVNKYTTTTDEQINTGNTYYLYGAPFQVTLNNRQNYNNCGVESTLNSLAMAGIIKMKDNLSDQKSVEKKFLKTVWDIGLVNDRGEIGVLDEADGGTEPDDYQNIFRQFDIESKSYFMTTRCDDTQFSDINELAYKISQGYGAVVGVCSNKLWQESKSETGKNNIIDHAIAITGVVYKDNSQHYTKNEFDIITYDTPLGFYIHDSGMWMSRYISLAEFKEVTLYEYHGMNPDDKDEYYNYMDDCDTAKYSKDLRAFDTDPQVRKYIAKKPNGIFVTITSEAIKSDMFDLNATGDNKDNRIEGNSGDNIIKGMAGNDTLYGNGGDDEIRGGKGSDIIIGSTLVSYDKNVLISYLNKYDASKDIKNLDVRLNKLNISDNYPEGINTLYGDAGNDIIIGGEDIDLIYGGDGNDYIYTGDGRNAAYGGKGRDVIVGGWDKDRLFGEAGVDYIYGLGDDDTIHGGAGNDHIWGGSGNDTIETGTGDDTIYFEGKEYGVDTVTSQSGKTIFKFIADGDNPGSEVSDMYFNLSRNDDNNKLFDLSISYTMDTEKATDGIEFLKFFSSKTGTSKTLTIIDTDESTYKVTASKASKVAVADKTKNNVLFSTRDKGATITTSTGNDVVTMVETEDKYNIYSESEDVFDKITYTGGLDTYLSEERNTYYYANKFDKDTTLFIFDNIKALEKVKVDDKRNPVHNPTTGEIEIDKTVVSTDDKLFINSNIKNVNFFFNVGLGEGGSAITTKYSGLFALDSQTAATNMTLIAKEFTQVTTTQDPTGFIYMDSFFGFDSSENTEIAAGKDFYGNGRIEELYHKQDDSNPTAKYDAFESDLISIASNVASWLQTHTQYSSAFEAIADGSSSDVNTLIAYYTGAQQ